MAPILKNEDVSLILRQAVEYLNALGLRSLLSPLSMPHGASISLVVGESREAAAAAHVAAGWGAQFAHNPKTKISFDGEVTEVAESSGLMQPLHESVSVATNARAPSTDDGLIVEWWLAQKPFGYSIDEYLERPDNWVSGAAKPLACRAAELYKQRQA